MKVFLAIAVLLMSCLSTSVFASNPWAPGFLLTSGDVSNPSVGTVLIDTGGLTPGATTDYYTLNFSLYCSIACLVEVGIFDSSNNPVSTYKVSALAGTTTPMHLDYLPATLNQKIRVRMSSVGLLGTVNVAMNGWLSLQN